MNGFFHRGFFFNAEPISSKLVIHILIALADGVKGCNDDKMNAVQPHNCHYFCKTILLHKHIVHHSTVPR